MDQDGDQMKPVTRKRNRAKAEVWEWLIKLLPQGELGEAADLPRGEDRICLFCNHDTLSFHGDDSVQFGFVKSKPAMLQT